MFTEYADIKKIDYTLAKKIAAYVDGLADLNDSVIGSDVYEYACAIVKAYEDMIDGML